VRFESVFENDNFRGGPAHYVCTVISRQLRYSTRARASCWKKRPSRLRNRGDTLRLTPRIRNTNERARRIRLTVYFGKLYTKTSPTPCRVSIYTNFIKRLAGKLRSGRVRRAHAVSCYDVHNARYTTRPEMTLWTRTNKVPLSLSAVRRMFTVSSPLSIAYATRTRTELVQRTLPGTAVVHVFRRLDDHVIAEHVRYASAHTSDGVRLSFYLCYRRLRNCFRGAVVVYSNSIYILILIPRRTWTSRPGFPNPSRTWSRVFACRRGPSRISSTARQKACQQKREWSCIYI